MACAECESVPPSNTPTAMQAAGYDSGARLFMLNSTGLSEMVQKRRLSMLEQQKVKDSGSADAGTRDPALRSWLPDAALRMKMTICEYRTHREPISKCQLPRT